MTRIRRRRRLPPIAPVEPHSTRRDGRLPNDPELAAERFFNLALFDDLPRPLRWALHEAIVSWDPRPFWRYLARQPMELGNAIRTLAQEERRDQFREAEKYWHATGTDLPHLAAGATILRYGKRESRDASRHATEVPACRWL